MIELENFSASNQENSSLKSDTVSLQDVLCSFLSDDRKQYAAITAVHSKHNMELLQNIKFLLTNKINIRWNTYGYAKQGRWATALYLLSMLSHSYNIVIYSCARAPGNGKYVVDGLNVTDKRFLYNIDENYATYWCSH